MADALTSISALLKDAGPRPPVESWHPRHCGDIDIVITRDGRWLHEGSPITREPMRRLFASVLRREPDGSHVLVTPAEKLTVTVEDAPFALVEMRVEGEGEARRLALRDTFGDWIEAGPKHPLRLVSREDGFRPYALVRARLEGLASRAVAAEIADLVEADGGAGLWAGGVLFPVLGPE